MKARILPLLTVAAWLTACGGAHIEFLFVSIGGTVNGLGPGLFLRISNNGSDVLTINAPGVFTFPAAIASGDTYDVTVTTQPVGESCTVDDGSGRAGGNISSVMINCVALAATVANSPGARAQAVSWRDDSGSLWLFGGIGRDVAGRQGRFNDLWRLLPGASAWQLVRGPRSAEAGGVPGIQGVSSSDSLPMARSEAVAWTDASGDFWIFGGASTDAAGRQITLDDLWRFSPGTGQWTWMAGSASAESVDPAEADGTAGPHARAGATAWTDGAGDLWLYGGAYLDANGKPVALEDLWRYSLASGAWSAVAPAGGAVPARGTASITSSMR